MAYVIQGAADFSADSVRFSALQKVSALAEDGELWLGFRGVDGQFIPHHVGTPGAARVAKWAALTASEGDRSTRRNVATTRIRAEAARVKAIAPASRTATDKFHLEVAFLLLGED